tara:strand:- start:1049 stop:1912 length:864 start_codon:yes stop_codon:yes gene_type:complete
MSKKVDTLVQDIYRTIDEGLDKRTTDKEFLHTFSKSIMESINKFLFEKRDDVKTLRLSQIGRPDRQLWYDIKSDIESKKIDAKTKIKFLYGEILESLLILLAEASGHEVSEMQKMEEVDGVKGHKDCRIDGTLVDIKSASSYSFKKFKDGSLITNDPFGYISQISAYAESAGDDSAGFVAVDKSTGELAYMPVESIHMINASDRVKHLKNVVKSSSPPPKCYPDEPDGKSGNMKLAIGCVFCGYKEHCWSDANQGRGLRKFKYSTGIRHLTQVHKTPDVEEVTNAFA